MLEVRGLAAGYATATVLRGVDLVVPDAGNLLMVQNPEAMAHGLYDFFSRHPIGDVLTHAAP